MANLITFGTLAAWTQSDEDEISEDPLAIEICEKMSNLARFLGGNTAWTLDPGENRVPIDVEMVILQVCKRSYENPTQVVAEGNVGPIGGDRHVEDYALFMSLSETERAIITGHNPDGDPNPPSGGQVFTIPTSPGPESLLPVEVLYVGDDQQINLSTSADPREWKIPLFNPGDPGGQG